MESFTGLNAQVLGISVDHIPCLQAWAESLGGIHYPLLSDFWPHGLVASLYGVLRTGEGISERAIFIVDKDGILRYIDIHDIADRPDNEEVRKVLRQIEGTGAAQKEAAGIVAYADALIDAPVSLDEDPELVPSKSGVVLYCARWCKDCRKVKAWLDEREIQYVEVDIDRDMAARTQVRKWANGFIVTPVIDFDGEIVLDFDVEKLESALRRHGQLTA